MEGMENGGTPQEETSMPNDDSMGSPAPAPEAAPMGGDTSMDDHDHDSMTDDELKTHMEEEHGDDAANDSGMEEGGNPNMPA